jgi:hypothetical protein
MRRAGLLSQTVLPHAFIFILRYPATSGGADTLACGRPADMSGIQAGVQFEETCHRNLSQRQADSSGRTQRVEVGASGRHPEAWGTEFGRCPSGTPGRDEVIREVCQASVRLPWQAKAPSRVFLRNPESRESSPEQRNRQMSLGPPRRRRSPDNQRADHQYRQADGSTAQEVAGACASGKYIEQAPRQQDGNGQRDEPGNRDPRQHAAANALSACSHGSRNARRNDVRRAHG